MILAGVFGVLCLAYGVVYEGRAVSWPRSLVKTGAIAALALAVATSGGGGLLVAALALSALGDLMLSRDGDRPFLAGMLAFFAAHVAYIALFAALGADGALLAARWPLAVLLALYAVIVPVFLWPGLGAFRLPVLAYAVAIGAMGLTAVALPPTQGAIPVQLGALLFILSDTVLAIAKFQPAKIKPFARVTPHIIWFFYCGGQALMAVGALGLSQ